MIRIRLFSPVLALIFASLTGAGAAETSGGLPQSLKDGLDLCVRNGHSAEQYDARLRQLGAVSVPPNERILSTREQKRDEWAFTIDGASYVTAYQFPATFCGVLTSGNFEQIKSAIIGPPLRFAYHHTNDGDQNVYKGRYEGEEISIMLSRHGARTYLVFVLDKKWEDVVERARAGVK